MPTLAPMRSAFGEEFWTPIDAEWDADRLYNRIMELSRWYVRMEHDPARARVASVHLLQSFWRYLSSVAWSIDEKSVAAKVKPFLPLPYVRTIADFITEQDQGGLYTHPNVILAKSRQMLASWMAAHLMLWTSLTRTHSKAIIISSTEETGARLLDRVKLAYTHLPIWFLKARGLPLNPDFIFQSREAKFPNGSQIIVLPEKGGHKIRSLSPNLVILDEAAFQDSFENSWTAVKGCTDARCLVWAISTAQAGFFERLFNDRLEGIQGGAATIHHTATGLVLGRNANNKCDTVRLHYTADPGKRTQEWKSGAEVGLAPYQWQQEFEINWESHGGMPIFPMFDPTVHISPKPYELDLRKGRVYMTVPNPQSKKDYVADVHLGLGIDHGRVNPCGAIQLALDHENDLFAVQDYSIAGRTATENAWAIKKNLRRDLPYAVEVIDAMMPFEGVRESKASQRKDLKVEDLYKMEDGDPRKPIMPFLRSCRKWKGSVQDGIDATCQLLLNRLAVSPQGADHPYWQRFGIEEATIEKMQKGRCLFISPLCAALVKEIQAARYQEKTDLTINQPETEVDRENHVRKALVYVLAERFSRFVLEGDRRM
jgi:hypothetical protein